MLIAQDGVVSRDGVYGYAMIQTEFMGIRGVDSAVITLQSWGSVVTIGSIAGTQCARRYAWLLGCHVGCDTQLHALSSVTGLASFGAGREVELDAGAPGWWLDVDVLRVGTITTGEGARPGSPLHEFPSE